MQNDSKSKWRLDGVRVVRATELDPNTPQTPGMDRAAAITHARAGAEKLWAGTVVIDPIHVVRRTVPSQTPTDGGCLQYNSG